MKRIRVVWGVLNALLFLCPVANAGPSFISHDNYLIFASSLTASGVSAGNGTGNQTTSGITYFKTEVDSWVSAQTVVSSDTIPSKTFTDGTQSTGSFTVSTNYVGLSSGSATDIILVSSNAFLDTNATTLVIGPYTFQNNVVTPTGWNPDVTFSSITACNLAAYIQANSVYTSTCGVTSGSSVTVTAPYGSSFNTYAVTSSSQAALRVQNANLSGGTDNAVACLNGTCVTANSQWFPAFSSTQTAANLATAFNTSASSLTVTVQASSNVVTGTSTVVGTQTAYILTTSTQSLLTVSAPVTTVLPYGASTVMTGGTSSAYTLNSSTLTLTNHSFSTGLQVLYSGTPAIGGLATGTTYYVTNLGQNTLGLATSNANAIIGSDIVITSSSSQTTAHTYTLAPLAITGTPSFQWMVSDDSVNWVPAGPTLNNLAISSVTLSAYTSTGTVNAWDFGHEDYGFLGLNVVAPTTGALNFKARVVGKSQ